MSRGLENGQWPKEGLACALDAAPGVGKGT
jgi:hypothetical protein